ncbi:MAG: DUF5689 domain-containing protein [Flavobacteriia bacterium]|nr:DUF5689 domain-containing protein [Flavobacteriia bacterium]
MKTLYDPRIAPHALAFKSVLKQTIKSVDDLFIPLKISLLCVFFIGCISCSRQQGTANSFCEDHETTIGFQALRDSVQDGMHLFKSQIYLRAYVVSSDQSGQFYGRLVLQEFSSKGPVLGAVLETDMTDTALWFRPGQKVYLNLKGLYADQKTLGLAIGSVFTSFGNLSIGRLPNLSTQAQLISSCEPPVTVTPQFKSLDTLSDVDLQTLVQIDSLKLDPVLLGQTFAIFEEDTPRAFFDPNGRKILLQSSGYSDFWNQLLPEAWVQIRGVLSKKRSQYHLEIRNLEDIVIQ